MAKKREYNIIVLENTSEGIIYQIDGTDIGGNYKTVGEAITAVEEYDNSYKPFDWNMSIDL